MIKNVKGARLSFGDARLRSRFAPVVDAWLTVAQQEQEKLGQDPDYIGRIDNPYSPNSPSGTLKPKDPLFRGRLDLAKMLEMELMKGERRPTFLMTGE